jgi:hypothetical protein
MTVEYKELKANDQTQLEQRNKIFDDISKKFATIGVEAGRDFITRSELETALAGVGGGGGSGGQVDTIVAGENISVDSSDPVNPEVSAVLRGNVGGYFIDPTAGDVLRGELGSDYDFTNWSARCATSSDIVFRLVVNGVDISSGGYPEISGSTAATGDTTAWAATTGVRGDLIELQVASVSTPVDWAMCTIFGDKS